MRFRKKPVEVEAMQVDGTRERAHQIEEWTDGAASVMCKSIVRDEWAVIVKTLEGVMTGDVGWWIIKGVQGEFYPCKDDIFHDTYDEVTE